MRRVLVAAVAAALVACGGNGSSEDADAGERGSATPGAGGSGLQFSISDSQGGGFDGDSPRARVGWAYDSMVDLRSEAGRISVDGRQMPDAGTATTTELGFNNTTYSRSFDIGGQTRSVSCKPGDPAVGRFERTALANGRISGRFEVEFVRCSDGMTGDPVEVDGLPITVTGSFDRLPLSD